MYYTQLFKKLTPKRYRPSHAHKAQKKKEKAVIEKHSSLMLQKLMYRRAVAQPETLLRQQQKPFTNLLQQTKTP
jgi:hypothetical protein